MLGEHSSGEVFEGIRREMGDLINRVSAVCGVLTGVDGNGASLSGGTSGEPPVGSRLLAAAAITVPRGRRLPAQP